jgi:3-hydroxyacyl-[acyl-carrier-protein] dehydratase
MPDAVQSNPGSSKTLLAPPKPFAPEDESALREALKRCSPSAFESAVQFRKTGNPEHVPAVVIGIVERFVEPDLRIKLKDADDDLRLIEDLGIDSLTMMEIVILVEDVLQLSINNDELRNLRNGDKSREFFSEFCGRLGIETLIGEIGFRSTWMRRSR